MRTAVAIFLAVWVLAGAAEAVIPKPVLPPPVQVPALSQGAVTRPVLLTHAVIAMRDGEIWHYDGGNFACSVSGIDYRWNSGSINLDILRYQTVFSDELRSLGFSNSGSDSLFEPKKASDDLEVGLKISDIRSFQCASLIGSTRDTMLISAEWQIYDPIRQEVLARIQTSGGVERPISSLRDLDYVLVEAFRENAHALLANEAFRQIVLKRADPQAATPTANTPITLAVAAKPAAARPISDVAGSVVAIFTGSGWGSGFLVSDDGYLITNQHVVGAGKTVRVRWSDGLETAGEVVRTDKRRDVALVKTEPRSRQPLALRRSAPAVGEAVFAIGTPLDEKLQNTVTKGIVSANRILDGFAYIQSDVGIDHGNSGGPLVDDKGRVIGITVIKIAPDDGQRGLNLFIPVGDALDFLALKTAP